MKKSGVRITLTLIIAVVAMSGMIILLDMWGSGPPAAHAQAGTGTIRVATTGTDAPGCGGPANPCRTVQYAVNQANGSEVIPSHMQTQPATSAPGPWKQTQSSATASGSAANGPQPPADNIKSAGGTNYTVDTLDDNTTRNYSCSLREAIMASRNVIANDDCGPGSLGDDTITFSVAGTITLSTPYGNLPHILDAAVAGKLIINGDGNITISGDNQLRVFYVDSGGDLTLQNLTVTHGTATDGGGIYNDGGTVAITNTTFFSNTATQGGGIYNGGGTVAITNTTFFSNTATEGGGILSVGSSTVDITNSTFVSNTAGQTGGGVFSFNTAEVTVTSSTFSGNRAGDKGGGLYNSGTVTIINSTFSGNTATTQYGGGLDNNGGRATIINSTFSGNAAGIRGGGLKSSGAGSVVNITNSTFSDNHASNAGGGLSNQFGVVNLTNSTLYGNSADVFGGGLWDSIGTTTLTNTIVANSTSGGNCAGTIANGGHNLDDGATCGWGNNNGSMSNTNPQLGTLTGNPVYYPLNPGSPAIDAGTNTGCPTGSQNGVTRPQDGDSDGSAVCDIGSYEAPAAVCAEDVNSDGVISIVDIQMVAAGWNGTDPNLDVDDDGDVDIDDVQQVAGRWRDSC